MSISPDTVLVSQRCAIEFDCIFTKKALIRLDQYLEKKKSCHRISLRFLGSLMTDLVIAFNFHYVIYETHISKTFYMNRLQTITFPLPCWINRLTHSTSLRLSANTSYFDWSTLRQLNTGHYSLLHFVTNLEPLIFVSFL